MTEAKKYLQEKHEWHRKHWNEHDHIDDNWWANEMQSYADEQVKKALEEVEKEMHKISVKYCLPISLEETQEAIKKLRK